MIIGAADKDSATSAGVELLNSWADNPGAAAFELFADPTTASGRLELQPHQVDVLKRVFAGRDVTWRAGHGVGKTTTLAILVFLWLLLRPRCKIPTTAPTWHQVRNVLWNEIAKWYEAFKFRHLFQLDKTKLSLIGRSATWFAQGVASNRQANLEGFHSVNLLYIGDEAKGIPNPIFDAMDGALTEGGQRIYCSTPGSRVGKFYDSHHGRISRFFDVVHTNGEDAARVSKKYIELKREEWGVDSSIYIAKIRGEFPQEGDDTLYPLRLVDEAEASFAEVRCTACGRTGPSADDKGAVDCCEAPSLVPAVAHGPHQALGCRRGALRFQQDRRHGVEALGGWIV
jgi:hypothetical protein